MTTATAPRAARDGGDLLDEALATVAAGATARDRAAPCFPEEAVAALERAGVLAPSPGRGHAAEWRLLRRIARADGSVGRIVDGHLNGMERVLALAPRPLREHEAAALAAGRRRIGVWGAKPVGDEGEPPRIVGTARGFVLEGVAVFCSGAGGVDRALVTADGGGPAPLLAYVDVTRRTAIDRDWYAGPGLRTSESHRVVFDGAPVIALLGGPGELVREPWFSRDAIRTAACWAGIADALADEALTALARRPQPDALAGLAAGRILGAVAAIDHRLRAAAAPADDPGRDLADESLLLRVAVDDACRTIIAESARALGSRPLAAGGALDRCRRDLELFLLQHRLDPMIARFGARELQRRAG